MKKPTAFILAGTLILALISFSGFGQACNPAPVTPLFTPVNTTINTNHTVTYTVSNAVAGTYYTAYDSATGNAVSAGVFAMTSGTLTITTFPFPTEGKYKIYIQSTLLMGTVTCTATSATGNVNVQPATLPLTLIRFTGKKNGNGASLEWVTANEINLSWFEIEMSADATSYQKIALIAAMAPGAGTNTYKFNVAGPLPPVAYFRLKMIDIDGKFSYSNIVVMRAGVIMAKVSPNPFQSQLKVELSLATATEVRLRLVDILGHTVVQKNYAGKAGENTFQLTGLNALCAGTYYAIVSTEFGEYQVQVMK